MDIRQTFPDVQKFILMSRSCVSKVVTECRISKLVVNPNSYGFNEVEKCRLLWGNSAIFLISNRIYKNRNFFNFNFSKIIWGVCTSIKRSNKFYEINQTSWTVISVFLNNKRVFGKYWKPKYKFEKNNRLPLISSWSKKIWWLRWNLLAFKIYLMQLQKKQLEFPSEI